MVTKISNEEYEILTLAEEDLADKGKTDIKCPRCGSEIFIEDFRSAYSVKCKTENCIYMDCRGI